MNVKGVNGRVRRMNPVCEKIVLSERSRVDCRYSSLVCKESEHVHPEPEGMVTE